VPTAFDTSRAVRFSATDYELPLVNVDSTFSRRFNRAAGVARYLFLAWAQLRRVRVPFAAGASTRTGAKPIYA